MDSSEHPAYIMGYMIAQQLIDMGFTLKFFFLPFLLMSLVLTIWVWLMRHYYTDLYIDPGWNAEWAREAEEQAALAGRIQNYANLLGDRLEAAEQWASANEDPDLNSVAQRFRQEYRERQEAQRQHRADNFGMPGPTKKKRGRKRKP